MDGQLDRVRISARSLRGAAHLIEQFRWRAARGEVAVAKPSRAAVRGDGVSSHDDGNISLGRPRATEHLVERDESPAIAGALLTPQRAHGGHVLIRPWPAILEGNAQALELLREPAHADP